jgi:hypothetical protein
MQIELFAESQELEATSRSLRDARGFGLRLYWRRRFARTHNPKAIAPTVAQISINRFKKSAIQSASGQKGPHLESHRKQEKAQPDSIRAGKVSSITAQSSKRLSQKIGCVDPRFCWQIEYP